MTDSQPSDTKPGPPNPQARGAEAASPPGGPLRQDEPGREMSGGHDDDASGNPAADKHASESSGHTIPIEDEQPGPRAGSEEDDVQEENAGSSLDQPSEG